MDNIHSIICLKWNVVAYTNTTYITKLHSYYNMSQKEFVAYTKFNIKQLHPYQNSPSLKYSVAYIKTLK